MRIISQDGLCDYSYDNSSLEIEEYHNKYSVFVYTQERNGSMIAEYSTKENAVNSLDE